jgi:cholesterol oxidase
MNRIDSHFDAVIVGSGFGGSINALRLAQSGKSVLVLERGRRYLPGQFPRDVINVNQLFWRYPDRPDSRGLYDVRFFSGIAAVVASGVGGGSLIYANIHIRPDPIVFEDPRWPRSITRKILDPYYDRIRDMLGVSPVPSDIPLAKRDAFRDAAQKTGHEVFDPDEAVNWSTSTSSAGRGPCRMVAECEFGCQYGAKNTMDLTYLREAENLGAKVEPNIYVNHVEPSPEGYRVHYVDLDAQRSGYLTGSRVVLSAGTLGTNEILLRSRNIGTLPRLSVQLGHGYSGNGDFLGSIQNSRMDLKPWEGTDVTSVIRYFESTPQFTMAAPTFNQPVMLVLASLGQRRAGWLSLLSPVLWPLLRYLLPWAFGKGLLSRPASPPGPNAGDPARMTNLFAIGRDNANGLMSLRRGRLDIAWDYARENAALVQKMSNAMQEIGDVYGGTFAPLLTWDLFHRIITVHSLGGCHLSETSETGVVSPFGEVHDYPGLFVSDGSVIPTSIGFHPVMTIAAISERIAENIVQSYSM